VSDEDDAFSVEFNLTRGTSTDDRDRVKAKASADSVEELDEKVERLRGRLEEWVAQVRAIQPDGDDVDAVRESHQSLDSFDES
jgi:hypothetical protein